MNLKLYFRFNFLPFLSEKNEEIANELLKEDDISYEESMNNDTYRPIVEKLIETLGFYIEPDYLFSNLIKSIETQTFQIEDLSTAIKNVENSTWT